MVPRDGAALSPSISEPAAFGSLHPDSFQQKATLGQVQLHLGFGFLNSCCLEQSGCSPEFLSLSLTLPWFPPSLCTQTGPSNGQSHFRPFYSVGLTWGKDVDCGTKWLRRHPLLQRHSCPANSSKILFKTSGPGAGKHSWQSMGS